MSESPTTAPADDDGRSGGGGIVDVDDDGTSELFFGLAVKGAPLYTIVLRYEADAWRELLRNERQRCHG